MIPKPRPSLPANSETMSPAKAILKKRVVQRMLSSLAALYVRLVYLTGRWREVDGDTIAPNEANPVIAAFWHGRMLMMPCLWRYGVPVQMLISRHGDGTIISGAIAHFGIGTIQGSTKKGGATALRNILRALESGVSIGITPDGPRGPRMRCTGAIADVAKTSGIPIVPVTYAARWRIVFGSWDRFILPLPFTRGVYVYGSPIAVAPNADSDATRLLIETQLNELTARADALMGVDAIRPADMAATGAGAVRT